MYSIQDFNEFARKTENKVRKFLREGKDLAELSIAGDGTAYLSGSSHYGVSGGEGPQIPLLVCRA